MSLNTTPRTWPAGEIVPASTMNTEIRDALTGIQAAWIAWTPVITNASATAVGTYHRIGKTVTADFKITLTGAATGTIIMSVPVVQAVTDSTYALGQAILVDTSAAARARAAVVAVGGSPGAFFEVTHLSAGATVNATVPWTWATGDIIGGSLTYRAA